MKSGVSPKKSPSTESVLKRRHDIKKSEQSAYWAIFNTSIASLLYYDLICLQTFGGWAYIEWAACAMFTASACYDFIVHFWPYTFMKPILVSPAEKKLLGIKEEEFGFKVEEAVIPKFEPQPDNLIPFEIQQLNREEEKVVTPTSSRSRPNTWQSQRSANQSN